MAGNKRGWDGSLITKGSQETTMESDAPVSTIQSVFTEFRNELDEHHDRRERIVKASRDITAFSKKIIFSLQRVRTLNQPLPKHIEKETNERFTQIHNLFQSIAEDVKGINAWRYQYQITWGIQEYIEALSFKHYIEKKEIISLKEITQFIPAEVQITETDYVLGLFDLTGEMMRFAITSIASGGAATGKGANDTNLNASVDGSGDAAGSEPVGGEGIVSDLRQLRAMFENLEVPHGHSLGKELTKKMEVMQASVEKVERAVYGLLVRGKERPPGWKPDLSSAAPVETY